MTIKTIVDENPSKEDVKLIYSKLLEFNTNAFGVPESKAFTVLLRDTDTGETLGGLHAVLFYGWAYITLLFIPEELRGQGLGLALLAEAETYVRTNKGQALWLDTYSFQAPGFYERAGFERFGELPNFPPGHSRIFFRKLLV
jgi:ribosomal protein S18 acetylase RimI-like enzyme